MSHFNGEASTNWVVVNCVMIPKFHHKNFVLNILIVHLELSTVELWRNATSNLNRPSFHSGFRDLRQTLERKELSFKRTSAYASVDALAESMTGRSRAALTCTLRMPGIATAAVHSVVELEELNR